MNCVCPSIVFKHLPDECLLSKAMLDFTVLPIPDRERLQVAALAVPSIYSKSESTIDFWGKTTDVWTAGNVTYVMAKTT